MRNPFRRRPRRPGPHCPNCGHPIPDYPAYLSGRRATFQCDGCGQYYDTRDCWHAAAWPVRRYAR